MFPGVLLPLLAAVVVAVAVTTIHRRMPPVVASRMLAVSLVVAAGAAVPTLWLVSLGYLGHLPILWGGLTWCATTFGVHARIPTWVGLPAVALSSVGVIRMSRVLRLHRRIRHDVPGSIEIAGHAAVFAFTLPGRGGHVVLSSGLIDLLDEQEQSVVLAHENAHARHRHDRYLLMGQLAAACTPFLRPLASRLEFSLERWADEEAVAANAGDRRLVAYTLGKVALHTLTPVGALSFAGLGVTARVAALLSPAHPRPHLSTLISVWTAIASSAVLAGFQLHHLARLVTAMCPG